MNYHVNKNTIGGLPIMETLDMIKSRKAIRHYTGQISDEQLQTLILAANAGPVGMGTYTDYRLTAIQDPKILSQMNGIYDASTVLVISVQDPGKMEYVSAGAIAQNIELAAENEGIGSNFNMASIASIPSGVIPDGFDPVFAVTLGLTDQHFAPRTIPNDRIKTNIDK
jgi:nitroreductase